MAVSLNCYTSFLFCIGGKRQNLIAQAKKGKTGCFILAALSLVDTRQHLPQVIVLASTPARVLKIYEYFGCFAGVPHVDSSEGVASIDFKGHTLSIRILAEGWKIADDGQTCTSQIVIGTPDCIKNSLLSSPNHQLDGRNIKLLILDQVDEMVKEKRSTASADSIKNLLLQLQSKYWCVFLWRFFYCDNNEGFFIFQRLRWQ
jgi:superfamily II DNA/RNA helicase